MFLFFFLRGHYRKLIKEIYIGFLFATNSYYYEDMFELFIRIIIVVLFFFFFLVTVIINDDHINSVCIVFILWNS